MRLYLVGATDGQCCSIIEYQSNVGWVWNNSWLTSFGLIQLVWTLLIVESLSVVEI